MGQGAAQAIEDGATLVAAAQLSNSLREEAGSDPTRGAPDQEGVKG
jgi:hypothetical protein